MARPRSQLNDILVEIVGKGHVYYQPPNGLQLSYPCIVYNREYTENERADDVRYASSIRYNVTLISTDPDDPAFVKLLDLPYSRQDRNFVSDQLYHDVFNIYF